MKIEDPTVKLFYKLSEALLEFEMETNEIASCRLILHDTPSKRALWWNGVGMIEGRLDRLP